MKALVVSAPGGPEVLRFADVERPIPREGEVLIRVHATALNRADVLQRRGGYGPPPGVTQVLGLECAGEVVQTRSPRFVEGDRVMALLPGGGYAEYVAVPAAHVMALPSKWTYTMGAAFPEVYLTAFQALRLLADVQAGQHVLVHAAASGVGLAALSLLRLWNAHGYGTASPEKHAAPLAMGARAVWDRGEPFADAARLLSEGHGMDVVLDPVGAAYAKETLDVLALDGHWVLIGLLGGTSVPDFALGAVLRKRITLHGTTLRNRSDAYKATLVHRFEQACTTALTDGRLEPQVDTVFPWTDAAEAHRRMEANATQGKLVLLVA